MTEQRATEKVSAAQSSVPGAVPPPTKWGYVAVTNPLGPSPRACPVLTTGAPTSLREVPTRSLGLNGINGWAQPLSIAPATPLNDAHPGGPLIRVTSAIQLAGDMDMSPSELSRRLNRDSEDVRPLRAKDAIKIIEVTGDLRPVYWLVERFLRDPEAVKQEALAQIPNLVKQLNALLEVAGAQEKVRAVK